MSRSPFSSVSLPARLLLGSLLLGPLMLGGAASAQTYQVQIQRTAHGIPHIQASDLGGIGYGVGYSYAQDNLCLLADQVMTVRGERSKFLGAEGKTVVGFQPVNNLDSDVFFKTVIEPGRLQAGYRDQPQILALMRGYVPARHAAGAVALGLPERRLGAAPDRTRRDAPRGREGHSGERRGHGERHYQRPASSGGGQHGGAAS